MLSGTCELVRQTRADEVCDGFKDGFKGRKVFKGSHVGLTVQKKGVKDVDYDVAAISGATVTCNGVTEMLHRGVGYYSAYFAQISK